MSSVRYAEMVARAEQDMRRKPLVCTFIDWADSNAQVKAYVLRTVLPPLYNKDLIRSRPPYFHPHQLSKGQAKQLVEHYFPGLKLRSSYKQALFDSDPYSHLLNLYNLEGQLCRREEPGFPQVLAGMYHFGQYLQEDIWVANDQLNVGDPGVHLDARPPGQHISLTGRRLLFWVVNDLHHSQRSLAWYDQLHQEMFIVDTHPQLVTARDPEISGEIAQYIRDTISCAGLRKAKDGPLQEVSCTSRPYDKECDWSSFMVIENFRMRILECREFVNRRDRVGYTDWARAGVLINRPEGSKFELTVQAHISAYTRELGCDPDHLRHPRQPLLKLDEHKEYKNRMAYQANWVFWEPSGTVPSIPDEDELFGLRGRDQSIYSQSAFRESRTPFSRAASTIIPNYAGSAAGSRFRTPILRSIEEGFQDIDIAGDDNYQPETPTPSRGIQRENRPRPLSLSQEPVRYPWENPRSSSLFVSDHDDEPQHSPEIAGPSHSQPQVATRYALRQRRIALPRRPASPQLPNWDTAGRGIVKITDTYAFPTTKRSWTTFEHQKELEKWMKEKEAIDRHNAGLEER